MDERERALALAALVEAFNVQDMTPVRTRAYEDGLKDIPIALLNAAVRKSIATRQFFPRVAELRADAEVERKGLRAAHPFTACADCNHTGWAEADLGGVVRAMRCECWQIHQRLLSTLGVNGPVLSAPKALPGAEDFDPRMAQLGSDL